VGANASGVQLQIGWECGQLHSGAGATSCSIAAACRASQTRAWARPGVWSPCCLLCWCTNFASAKFSLGDSWVWGSGHAHLLVCVCACVLCPADESGRVVRTRTRPTLAILDRLQRALAVERGESLAGWGALCWCKKGEHESHFKISRPLVLAGPRASSFVCVAACKVLAQNTGPWLQGPRTRCCCWIRTRWRRWAQLPEQSSSSKSWVCTEMVCD